MSIITSAHLEKRLVAESFSSSASTYDQLAFLQQDVAVNLMKKVGDLDNRIVADLGCGTGFCFDWLQQNKLTTNSCLLGVDLAEGMVKFAARSRHHVSASWICGDAERLPLADNSIDVMFSSLAIQWCEDLDSLMTEIKRVLKPGGKFWFATLGPKTLHELRSAWHAVDNYVHVNEFVASDSLKARIKANGLSINDWQESFEVYHYDEVRDLTKELKGIGAHNVNEGRPAGLTGKARILKFKQAYEAFRLQENGKLPATYEVYYGCVTQAAL